MSLLKEVSDEKEYELDLEAIARIWRGGCIIRAALLEDIRKAYVNDSQLKNLMVAPIFSKTLLDLQQSCRIVIKQAIDAGIPVLAFSSSLNYFDAYRRGTLASKPEPKHNVTILVLTLMNEWIGRVFFIRSGYKVLRMGLNIRWHTIVRKSFVTLTKLKKWINS